MPKSKFEPFTVHFLAARTVMISSSQVKGSRVFTYGDELEVTQEIVELNTDRNGNCPLLEVIEDGEQVRRGPWPEGKLRLQPGSPEFEAKRESDRQEAHKIEDPEKRRAALADVRATYGSAPTSRTIMFVPGDDV